MHERAAELIRHLGLEPHPEGGWYRETYRAIENVPGEALPERFAGARSLATSIYFLLTSDNFSSLHRLKSDELWHFYAGSPLVVHVITPLGEYQPLTLGPRLSDGQIFQAVVPNGCWFGATVLDQDAYSLVGCTVSPGFDFADFELAECTPLIARFPEHAALIRRLTRTL